MTRRQLTSAGRTHAAGRRLTRLLAALSLVVAACSSTPPAAEPEVAGQRLRCRIAGRGQEPSITTAAYRIYLVLQGPDGRRETACLHVPPYAESEYVAGYLGVLFEELFALADLLTTESRHGEPTLVHDLVLPRGCSIDLRPGAWFVCRRVGESTRFVAEADAEITLGLLRADGAGYDEPTPAHGVEATFDAAPPGWPPAGR